MLSLASASRYAASQPLHWRPRTKIHIFEHFFYITFLTSTIAAGRNCHRLLPAAFHSSSCHTHMHIIVKVPRITLSFELARKSKHREVSRPCQYAAYRFPGGLDLGVRRQLSTHCIKHCGSHGPCTNWGQMYTRPAASAAGKLWLIRSGPVLCRLLSGLRDGQGLLPGIIPVVFLLLYLSDSHLQVLKGPSNSSSPELYAGTVIGTPLAAKTWPAKGWRRAQYSS